MFRLEAFTEVGGFDPSVVAGEEPQLCLRLRHSNWKLLRVDVEMTLHDSQITRIDQWWRRQVRGGYGSLDVYDRFEVGGERLFAKATRSAVLWVIGWPSAVIIATIIGGIARGREGAVVAALVVLLALPLQITRLSVRALCRGVRPRGALGYGMLTMLAKWGWFCGQVKYRRHRARGQSPQLIEYKPNPARKDFAAEGIAR